MAGNAVEGVHIAGGHQVLIAEFIGVQPHFPGNVLHHALQGKIALRDAVAPHGAGGGAVGVDGVRLAAVGQLVQVGLAEAGDGVGRDGVPVGGVAPLVGYGHARAGHEIAVPVHRGAHVKGNGMAGAGVPEGLLPAGLQLDAAAARFHTQPGVQGLVEHFLFVAEAAADVRLDDPHPAPGDPQRLPHHPAHDVGDLSGGDHHDAPALPIGVGGGILNVAVLDLLGLVVPGKPVVGGAVQHVPGAAEVRGRQGDLGHGVLQDIVRMLFVDGRYAGRHGGLGREDGGIFLILYPDPFQRPPGGDLIHRHHGGDIVSIDAHPPVEQFPVGHVLVGRLHAPGVAGGGILDLRHVEAGEHLHHPGQRFGRRGVHAFDPSVGDGAVEDLGHQRIAGAEVVGILGAAGHLVHGVHPLDTSADFHKTHLLICPKYTAG